MKFRMAAAFAAMACLSGCFEMSQDYAFRSDGTATVNIRMAVDAALIAMAAKDGASPSDWCGRPLAKKEGITVTTEASTEGADSVCDISASGKIEDLVKAIAEVDTQSDSASQGMTLTRSGENYLLAIEMPPFETDKTSGNDEMSKAIKAMMLARMSGRVLKWSVTAPQIIASSGEVTEDRTKATYSRPLAEAFSSAEPTVFNVEFSIEEPGLFNRVKRMFE